MIFGIVCVWDCVSFCVRFCVLLFGRDLAQISQNYLYLLRRHKESCRLRLKRSGSQVLPRSGCDMRPPNAGVTCSPRAQRRRATQKWLHAIARSHCDGASSADGDARVLPRLGGEGRNIHANVRGWYIEKVEVGAACLDQFGDDG